MAEERRRSADRIADTAKNTAQEALHRIDTHERVCTERYLQIVKNQEDEQERQKDRHEQNVGAIQTINDRMWLAAGGLIVVMLGLITTLILTSPHTP